MYTKETCIEIIHAYVTKRMQVLAFDYCILGTVEYKGQCRSVVYAANCDQKDFGERYGETFFRLSDEDRWGEEPDVWLDELSERDLNNIVNKNPRMLDDFEKENLPDTTRAEIETQQSIKVEGLYAFDDVVNKITPWCIYFGIDFWQNGCEGGYAYFHYLNALRPVYLPDGTHYRVPHLRNVCAKYKNGVLTDFYRE